MKEAIETGDIELSRVDESGEVRELTHEQAIEQQMLEAKDVVDGVNAGETKLAIEQINELGESKLIEEPKQPEKSDAQEMAEFIANDDNKKNAVSLAAQIQQYMGNKWFTVEKFQSKTRLQHLEATQKLQMVKLFGHAQLRVGNVNDGPAKSGKPLFKIAISKEMQLRAIDEVIAYHEHQIEEFKLKKKAIG